MSDEAIKSLEKLQKEYNIKTVGVNPENFIRCLRVELTQTEDLLRKAIEVIKFYGDKENYIDQSYDGEFELLHDHEQIGDNFYHAGKAARKFLADNKKAIERLNEVL
jgi:hypothetical protein